MVWILGGIKFVLMTAETADLISNEPVFPMTLDAVEGSMNTL
jgi:hypothetical protein